MRGRRPKPVLLKVLSGNPGNRKLNKAALSGWPALGDPPAWLSADERAIWHEIVEDAPSGLFKAVDSGVLAALACSISTWRDAAVAMRSESRTVPTGDGVGCKANPLVGIMHQESLGILRLCAELGITPASRSRLRIIPDAPASNPAFERFNPRPVT